MSDEPTVTVAVLTYRRNDELTGLLPELLDQLDSVEHHDCELLVVDNDAAEGARNVVAGLEDPRVRYAVEPRPGIAAARNQALDRCRRRDLLVFIDDDERPTAQWLMRLLDAQRRYGAAAVAGPVRSQFDIDPDPWIVAGAFFGRRHRAQLATGTPVPVAATNNLLLDLREVRRHGLRFPEDVAMAGGEDNLLTARLTKSGGVIVWCAEAWVVEPVPADRMTRRWVLSRSLSSGNVLARTRLALVTGFAATVRVRTEMLLGGLLRVLGGAGRYVVGRAGRSLEHEARGARTASRGLGMALGASGYSYQAYRRATDEDAVR